MNEADLLAKINLLEDRIAQMERRENHRFSVLESDGDIKTEGGIVAGSLTYDPPANNIILLNPNNESASVGLRFNSDIANIRYGGSGAGSANGFEIQGTSDAVKFKVTDGGGIQIPGGMVIGTLAVSPTTGQLNVRKSAAGIAASFEIYSDTDEETIIRMDKRNAAGTNNKRWDFHIDDATGVLRLRPGDLNAPFRVSDLGNNFNAMEVDTSDGSFAIEMSDALTVGHAIGLIMRHRTSGAPAGGFGNQIRYQLESTTTQNRDAAAIGAQWEVATDASRRAGLRFFVYDATTSREVVKMDSSGTAPRIGFFGTTPAGVQNVTGSRGGNAALASLINALAVFGLITDGTSA